MKDVKPRQPQKGKRFSWARVKVGDHRMEWRLYRRSETTNRVFYELRLFTDYDDRRNVAAYLRSMRNRLRDNVDAYDLANMGIEA